MDFVTKYDSCFVQKHDALERLELSILQKCTVTINMLVYGLFAYACNEYCKLDESIVLVCMKRVVITIYTCFDSIYLKKTYMERF